MSNDRGLQSFTIYDQLPFTQIPGPTIRDQSWENAGMILSVTWQRAEQWVQKKAEIAESLGVQYFETSEGQYQHQAYFWGVVDKISEKMAESTNFNRKGTRKRNSESTPTSSGGCGC